MSACEGVKMDEVNQASANSNAPSEGGDISKTTITVLVLLTLMISVIGTWTVLNEVNSVKVISQGSSSSGVVSLNIQPPISQSEPVAASGKVVLNILN